MPPDHDAQGGACPRPRFLLGRRLTVRLALAIALLSSAGPAFSDTSTTATITSIRTGVHRTYTRIVMDLDRPAAYELRESADGREWQLTLLNTTPAPGVSTTVSINSPHMTTVRLAQPSTTTTQATITLKGLPARRLFTLEHPRRLVLDLMTQSPADAPSTAAAVQPPAPIFKQTAAGPIPRTIVIDPGHGGKDPGAIGRNGLEEKDVVLDIGLRLKKLLEQQGHRVIMTRSDDRFISLDERTQLANKEQADLFVSIHANASPKRSTKGTEIYLLGRASDAAARATAARENGDSDSQLNDLDRIFSDMNLDFRINHSISLAYLTRSAFIKTVGQRYSVVDLGVKRAPFYVLMTSTMPGILAEISFISNSQEEARLKRPLYRQKTAEALEQGIRQYLTTTAIPS